MHAHARAFTDVSWPLFRCGVKNDGRAVKKCETGKEVEEHGLCTVCIAHVRTHERTHSLGFFIIKNNIISFRGQQGQSCLARNACRVGGHGARRINDINDARTSEQIAVLGVIGQGTMLVDADLIIIFVVHVRDGDCLLVHLLVKAEQSIGHHVEEVRQASGLSSVRVMNCVKLAHRLFDALVASCLGRLDKGVGAHSVVFGWL